MNKSTSNILREVEDFSDDFFQSKHINKRKEDLQKRLDKEREEALSKLTKGIEKIKASYNNKSWNDDKEKLFLELFSYLHVDDNLYQCDYLLIVNNIYSHCINYRYGYYLRYNNNNVERCFYNLKTDEFFIDAYSIWEMFEYEFHMSRYDVNSLMINMLIKYFDLYNIRPIYADDIQTIQR